MASSELPPDLERLAKLVDEQPPKVRGGFQFLLAIALEESVKAELINVTQLNGRTYYSTTAMRLLLATCSAW